MAELASLNSKKETQFPVSLDKDVLEKLLSDVAHKIKNSLGGINGFTTLLERDLGNDDPRSRLTQRIQKGVYKLNNIIVDLMFVLRNEAPEIEKISAQSLLNELIANYQEDEKQGTQAIPILNKIPKNNIALYADPHLIRQIISYAFQVINFAGDRIEQIEISAQNSQSICILYHLISDEQISAIKNLINLNLEKINPIEIRLIFAALQRIITLHHGRLSLTQESNYKYIFTVQIDQRCKK